MGELEGKSQRGKGRGVETEGKRQRGKDRGVVTEEKRHRERDRGERHTRDGWNEKGGTS